MSEYLSGLTHQTTNFKTLIKYCYLNNLKLVKPIFTLIGKHNKDNEIKNDLSKYYDLEILQLIIINLNYTMIMKVLNIQ